VLRQDDFSLKLSTLTPGYCRAYFDKLSTSPLFDKKKRGFLKQNISFKNTINSMFKLPSLSFQREGPGVSPESLRLYISIFN
jgi:hypothetical protein